MEPIGWASIILRVLGQFGPVWIALIITFVVSILYKRKLGLYGKLFDSNIGMIGFALVMFWVFTAFFGTILGAYELYVRTTHECLRPVSERVRRMPLSRLRPWVVAYCGIGGLAIMWLGGNPVQIVTPAAIFGGVLTCGMWCLLMVWTDRRFLPPGLRMGALLLWLNVASGIFLTAWGVRGVIEYLGLL